MSMCVCVRLCLCPRGWRVKTRDSAWFIPILMLTLLYSFPLQMVLHKYYVQVVRASATVAAPDYSRPLLYHNPNISLISSSLWRRFFSFRFLYAIRKNSIEKRARYKSLEWALSENKLWRICLVQDFTISSLCEMNFLFFFLIFLKSLKFTWISRRSRINNYWLFRVELSSFVISCLFNVHD